MLAHYRTEARIRIDTEDYGQRSKIHTRMGRSSSFLIRDDYDCYYSTDTYSEDFRLAIESAMRSCICLPRFPSSTCVSKNTIYWATSLVRSTECRYLVVPQYQL